MSTTNTMSYIVSRPPMDTPLLDMFRAIEGEDCCWTLSGEAGRDEYTATIFFTAGGADNEVAVQRCHPALALYDAMAVYLQKRAARQAARADRYAAADLRAEARLQPDTSPPHDEGGPDAGA